MGPGHPAELSTALRSSAGGDEAAGKAAPPALLHWGPGSAPFCSQILTSGTVRCPWLEVLHLQAFLIHTHPGKGLLLAAGQWCCLHPADWEISICRVFLNHPHSCSAKPVWLLHLHYCATLGNHFSPHSSTSFTYILHKEVGNTWDKIQNILIKFVLLPSALLPRLKLNIAKASLLVGTNTNSWNKGMTNQGQVALTLPSGWGDCCLSMMTLAGFLWSKLQGIHDHWAEILLQSLGVTCWNFSYNSSALCPRNSCLISCICRIIFRSERHFGNIFFQWAMQIW